MAGKTALLETRYLNREMRQDTAAIGGGNASTTVIVSTNTGTAIVKDDVVLMPDGTYHLVTASTTTTVTITPAMAVAPTTGNIVAVAYAPAGVWIALFTAAPSDAGGGTEAAYGSYARVQVTKANASWAAPSGTPSATSNSGTLTFPTSTGSGSTLTHFASMDAASGGNTLRWGVLGTPQAVGAAGITPSFAAGQLAFSED